jgi:hypothetical protein
MLKLLQVAGDRVVFKIAVATIAHARLGLTVVAVRLHVFPTSGQSDEIIEMTVKIEVSTPDIGIFVTP